MPKSGKSSIMPRNRTDVRYVAKRIFNLRDGKYFGSPARLTNDLHVRKQVGMNSVDVCLENQRRKMTVIPEDIITAK